MLSAAPMGHFLIIDPDEGVCARIRRRLASDGHFATSAPDLPSAARLLERLPFDVVICDLSPPGGAAPRPGPFRPLGAWRAASCWSPRATSPPSLPTRPAAFRGFVGRCPEVREALRLAARAAPTDAGVLLTGEPGTGKDRLAREIHRHSRRRSFPFVPVDCAALPACPAGRGADRPLPPGPRRHAVPRAGRRAGRRRPGAGGPRAAGRRLRRRGCAVRVIGASAGDPVGRLEEGRLRPDLFFRLAVVPITLPPCGSGDRTSSGSPALSSGAPAARLGREARRLDPSACRRAAAPSLAGQRGRAGGLHRAGGAAFARGVRSAVPELGLPADGA